MLIGRCCTGYLTNPGSHGLLANNFNATFNLNKSDVYAQEFVFTKNADKSIRVSVSAHSSGIKSFERYDPDGTWKTYELKKNDSNGTKTNSLTYTFAFDVKLGDKGPVVTPVDGQPSTLTLDFRGNVFEIKDKAGA